MPRTRGSAATIACLRDNFINEPFNPEALFDSGTPTERHELYASYSVNVDPVRWQRVIDSMNDANSASKIMGHHLQAFIPARRWWESVQENDTHEIFTLIRDRETIALSWLSAHHFGWSKETEVERTEVTVSDYSLYLLANVFDNFFRYMPAKSRVVTFDTLPKEYFDHSRIWMVEQHSLNNLRYIKNLDHCLDVMRDIIKAYDHDWQKHIIRRTQA